MINMTLITANQCFGIFLMWQGWNRRESRGEHERRRKRGDLMGLFTPHFYKPPEQFQTFLVRYACV
jgi:hypothetical protein